MNLYVVQAPDGPWGDYGRILVHGMSTHQGRDVAGGLQLERTGPFIPPITFPGLSDVVVVDSLRKQLEGAGFELSFQPVVMKRIVRLDWHEWDLTADEPKEYPAGGEPENYILRRRHDEALAESMKPLWEVVSVERAGIQVEGTSDVDLAKYNREDLIRASRWGGYLYASERLTEWLRARVPEWVRFRTAVAV